MGISIHYVHPAHGGFMPAIHSHTFPQAVPPAVSVAAVAAAASPDGRTVYVAGSDGRLALLTDNGAPQLQLVDEFRADIAITCLALPSGDGWPQAHAVCVLMAEINVTVAMTAAAQIGQAWCGLLRVISHWMMYVGSGARALFAGTENGSVRAYRLPLTAGQCQVRFTLDA
jgi:hypothetical protein